MLTLNNVLKRLENFASSHKFINTFSFGSPEDIDKTDGVEYPLMHVVQIGSTHDGDAKKKTYEFSIVFADRPTESNDKVGYQAEVQSDMEQCAEDLLNDIYNGGNIFTQDENFGIGSNGVEYFDEDDTNTLSGAVLTISITVPYRLDACALPLDSITPTSTTCADATVENSDQSYQVNVASGGTLVLPDSSIRNSDNSWNTDIPATTNITLADFPIKGFNSAAATDTIVTVPYDPNGYTHGKLRVYDQNDSIEGYGRVAKDIKILGADITSVTESSTQILITPTVPVCPTPSGICYQSPMVSQKTSYRTGDEGWQITNGIWNTTDPTYPDHKAKLDMSAADPFVTMAANNAFGNTSRFTDEAGVASTANTNTSSGLVIDHLTGLMWYGIASAGMTWNDAIDAAVASTQGGYSNWYLPPKTISDDLLKVGANTTGVPGFMISDINLNWTGSTRVAITTFAYVYYGSGSEIYGYHIAKTNNTYRYVMVRRHY
jgi:hypothetical protein